MPPRFNLLIAAQFASALADSALFIVTIALLQAQHLPGWWAPLLKFGFTVSYVVFAPFIGPLADSLPKAFLMACMNAVKMCGVVALLLGAHPMAAFALVGFGAAAYGPAKYGLIAELVRPEHLVAANGWLEVSVVCAALLGTVAGGVLVSPWALDPLHVLAAHWFGSVGASGPSSLTWSLLMLLALYAVAGLLNIGVPGSGATYPVSRLHVMSMTRDFWRAHLALWRDRDGGLSLAVTTLFRGVGATLQFIVLKWAENVLHLPLGEAAYLQAAVAIGIVPGAVLAARYVPLAKSKTVLIAGVALGLMMPMVAMTTDVTRAVPLLVAVGCVGGILVVPLNALLQHRGYLILSPGRSVAVQGFNENASVLAMLGLYAALVAFDTDIVTLMWGFGLTIAAALACLILRERARDARDARDARRLRPAPADS